MFLEHGEDIPSCFWVFIFILAFMVIDFIVLNGHFEYKLIVLYVGVNENLASEPPGESQ